MFLGKLHYYPSAGFFLYIEELSIDLGLVEQMLFFSLPLNRVEVIITIELRLVNEIRIALIRG